MGRAIWSETSMAKWNGCMDGESPRSASATAFGAMANVEGHGLEDIDAVEIQPWRKAPFDIDAPLRDDHVRFSFDLHSVSLNRL